MQVLVNNVFKGIVLLLLMTGDLSTPGTIEPFYPTGKNVMLKFTITQQYFYKQKALMH